jgi:hypothetical protein
VSEGTSTLPSFRTRGATLGLSAMGSSCICGNLSCPAEGGGFYLVATRARGEPVLAAGPFDTHIEAVDAAHSAYWWAFRTTPLRPVRWTTTHLGHHPLPAGMWNAELGLDLDS